MVERKVITAFQTEHLGKIDDYRFGIRMLFYLDIDTNRVWTECHVVRNGFDGGEIVFRGPYKECKTYFQTLTT